jgi:hypothetical protein
MVLQQSVRNIIRQLVDSLQLLSNEQYCREIPTLSDSSIGHHVRHVIEMFILLQEGLSSGIVNYEKRNRDPILESSKDAAIAILKQITNSIQAENKDLVVEIGFDKNNDLVNYIPSNYYREIAYNMEHAIHHMALIKIGIKEVSEQELPSDYGVASSTIRYRESKILTNR